MNRGVLFCCLVFVCYCVVAGARGADQCLYLSAGGGVSVFGIDGETGELNAMQELELEGAGPMAVSPGGEYLYVSAALDGAGGQGKGKGKDRAIATLEVMPDGTLQLYQLSRVNLAPGYLKADKTGEVLAGSHYGPGKVTIWKLSDGVWRGERTQELELEEKAHSAVFSPDNRFLLVPATGPNKVFQLRFDGSAGAIVLNDPPFSDGPKGDGDARQPRHLVFHPDGEVVYTTLERERPGVGVWAWDAEKGVMAVVQNIVTQPDDFDGTITTADLHLTPDAKFLYVSNRDLTDRKARTGRDSIVGFSVDAESGRLTKMGHTACEHVPRSFAIDETGRFVYVAGQGDDRLGVYRIDGETGALEKVTQYATGARPGWVECVGVRG